MVFDVELLNLILYCVQQLGVALGLGAQTIMLVAYLNATRDGVIDTIEAQFLRATRRVLLVSLFLIVLSGVAITALHVAAGQGATILEPAYLFKWLLIAVVILLTTLAGILPETFDEGLLGANWYALFVVHILAPVTTWINLLTLWAVWLVGFVLCWYALVLLTHDRKGAVVVKTPTPQKEAKPIPVIVEEPKPEIKKAAAQMPKIVLDPGPKTVPVVIPLQQRTPTTYAPATFQPPVSSVKSPANRATDTPFLPQVPPLLPIPVAPPKPAEPPTAAPALQPTTTPPTSQSASRSDLSGVNVMPKSPGDIQ